MRDIIEIRPEPVDKPLISKKSVIVSRPRPVVEDPVPSTTNLVPAPSQTLINALSKVSLHVQPEIKYQKTNPLDVVGDVGQTMTDTRMTENLSGFELQLPKEAA